MTCDYCKRPVQEPNEPLVDDDRAMAWCSQECKDKWEADQDPTRYCTVCGARTRTDCDCPPAAENE
jgi:hypothetical protein